jgi:hypothetical protein
VADDPGGSERRADHIRHLVSDAGVAGQVRAGLARRVEAEAHAVGPTWLCDFLRNTGGGLALHLRLGDDARRLGLLRHAVFAGATEAVLCLLPH